jgi:IS30 family transposase
MLKNFQDEINNFARRMYDYTTSYHHCMESTAQFRGGGFQL